VHYQETIGCHGNVPQRIEKLISDCSHSSISHENLAKIGEVDFEIIGPTGIVKMLEIRSCDEPEETE